MTESNAHVGVILIVDDDDAVRDSLSILLESIGNKTFGLSNAADCLAYLEERADEVACMILDIRMPGMSGMELQAELAEKRIEVPIIFITGHGDVPMAVEAMKQGAVEFLQKPFREQALLDSVNRVLTQQDAKRQEAAEHRMIQQKIDQLTPREHQVMELILDGKANKVIAFDLNVSQRTVEIHRANLMKKMGVRSVAELARHYFLLHPEKNHVSDSSAESP